MSASYWPSIDPESVGIEREALSVATTFVRQHNSTAFLLAHTDGLVCAEYWHCEEGFGGDNSPLAPTFTDDEREREQNVPALENVCLAAETHLADLQYEEEDEIDLENERFEKFVKFSQICQICQNSTNLSIFQKSANFEKIVKLT